MSTEINSVPYINGPIKNNACVWTGVYAGIVLASQLVEMDIDVFEWLYEVLTPIGIDEFWAYEIKPVNFFNQEYNNNITHKIEGV